MLVVIKDMFEKNMDKMEKKFDEKIGEVKRYAGALVEDLRMDVKAVADEYSILNNKLDRVEVDVQTLKVDVQTLKVDVHNLKMDVQGLKTDMSVVKSYVIGVDAKLNEHDIIFKKVK